MKAFFNIIVMLLTVGHTNPVDRDSPQARLEQKIVVRDIVVARYDYETWYSIELFTFIVKEGKSK